MKYSVLIFRLLFVMLLVSCGPSKKSIASTQTSTIATQQFATQRVVTDEAFIKAVKLTQTNEALHPSPSLTPRPPSATKTIEQKVADCEKINTGVRYVLTGVNVSAASLTLQNASNGTEQGDFTIPYCRIFSDFKGGDFVYISAQILQGSGSLTCKIYDGNNVISEASATGKI